MNFVVCQGQSCGSNSRVFVHDALYDEFLDAAAARLDAMRVGAAYDPETEMGPLVTKAHHERVLGYVAAGREDGARLVAGGSRPAGLDDGFFLRPTLFADVDMSMRVAREEIFGPIVSVFRWSDYDTVIRQANDVELGLTASIWTNDLSLAHKTAAALDAGYIWINDSTKHYWGTPFGGTKNSGLGREESTDELVSYYELKAVHTILRDPHHALARLGRSG
jgi:acyl-CoA reductase-like NAD-dependent aldehyde dehydrogenase